MNDLMTNQDADRLYYITHKLIDIKKYTGWCFFIDYSGHVNRYDIKIAKSNKDYNSTILRWSLAGPDKLQDILDQLSIILEAILTAKGLNIFEGKI